MNWLKKLRSASVSMNDYLYEEEIAQKLPFLSSYVPAAKNLTDVTGFGVTKLQTTIGDYNKNLIEDGTAKSITFEAATAARRSVDSGASLALVSDAATQLADVLYSEIVPIFLERRLNDPSDTRSSEIASKAVQVCLDAVYLVSACCSAVGAFTNDTEIIAALARGPLTTGEFFDASAASASVKTSSDEIAGAVSEVSRQYQYLSVSMADLLKLLYPEQNFVAVGQVILSNGLRVAWESFQTQWDAAASLIIATQEKNLDLPPLIVSYSKSRVPGPARSRTRQCCDTGCVATLSMNGYATRGCGGGHGGHGGCSCSSSSSKTSSRSGSASSSPQPLTCSGIDVVGKAEIQKSSSDPLGGTLLVENRVTVGNFDVAGTIVPGVCEVQGDVYLMSGLGRYASSLIVAPILEWPANFSEADLLSGRAPFLVTPTNKPIFGGLRTFFADVSSEAQAQKNLAVDYVRLPDEWDTRDSDTTCYHFEGGIYSEVKRSGAENLTETDAMVPPDSVDSILLTTTIDPFSRQKYQEAKTRTGLWARTNSSTSNTWTPWKNVVLF
jgi:hypothetical protein